ncbi:cupin [Psychrobacillus glaciei]|uniref:Cupin n=1 Tax=Psychrobacillus glaciei TaxID=2283160 RepID=A0A5J6SNG7_9BACI|nr:cupin [Psychrobacillus glaciei]QFF99329.1 cupin [Psychrobacillus glaciei]
MKLFIFEKQVGKNISHFNSDFIMSRIVRTEKPTQIGCMYLETNGVVGYHEAVVPQLLLVISGEGWVRGEAGLKVKVKVGDAVLWKKGEGHETTTETGLTAIVIESEELNPSEFMLEK